MKASLWHYAFKVHETKYLFQLQPARTMKITWRILYAYLYTTVCRYTASSQTFNTMWPSHMLLPLFPMLCMAHIRRNTLEQSVKWKLPFNVPQPLFFLGPSGNNEPITTQWKGVLQHLLSRVVFCRSQEVNGLKSSARGSISCILAKTPNTTCFFNFKSYKFQKCLHTAV